MEGIGVNSGARANLFLGSPVNPRVFMNQKRFLSVGLIQNDFRKCLLSRVHAQKGDSNDRHAILTPSIESESAAANSYESERNLHQGNVCAEQGIRIRRRPPTGPPLHYVGPFEFRLQNEGNTPRNILEEIIWNKDTEVSQLKERTPLVTLKKALENAPPARDFIGALKASHWRTNLPALIAEVKKASPSRGVLREDFDPVQIAKAYEAGGAACLSVLTDEKYFQGSFDNLVAIRNAGVKCPLLCKEFIIDAWQIYNARVKGADAVLLIAAVLPDLDIKYMTKICKILGLTALVEVHDEREMDRILGIEGIQLIGINNRNLETFEVDISNTKRLLEGERGNLIRQRDIIVVGESGLFTPDDIAYVQSAGVKAVLVGESIVKQTDPTKGIAGLFGKEIGLFVIDKEECFWHRVPYEGVTGPLGEQVHDSRHRPSDMFEFVVRKRGLHQFCFINRSPYSETIEFDLRVGHFTVFEEHAKDEHFKPVLEQINRLEEALHNVQFEQHWLEAQTERQALVNEGMSKRAIHKALTESAALICASILQVYLLQRLFERKLGTSRV